MNPFLGVRAIRLCLSRPELFKPQLRAALRASAGRNLKIMFPMVATVGEVRAARALLDECRAELLAEGQAVAEEMEIGIMVEIPATAVMADRLAAEVDFFSIGTNDLAQYTMAADRTNADVASLAIGFQPAVLRLVRDVIAAAHAQGKWVGLCGELAGEPLAAPVLLGLGLDEFSMNPPDIPLVKQIIRKLALVQAQEIAEAALALDSPEAVQALVRERVPAANVG
jgi:phosphotransferase system enzyme I (PtsI)